MPACALACAHPKASAQASSIAAKPAIGDLGLDSPCSGSGIRRAPLGSFLPEIDYGRSRRASFDLNQRDELLVIVAWRSLGAVRDITVDGGVRYNHFYSHEF